MCQLPRRGNWASDKILLYDKCDVEDVRLIQSNGSQRTACSLAPAATPFRRPRKSSVVEAYVRATDVKVRHAGDPVGSDGDVSGSLYGCIVRLFEPEAPQATALSRDMGTRLVVIAGALVLSGRMQPKYPMIICIVEALPGAAFRYRPYCINVFAAWVPSS